jgi:hypothetical protein
MDLATLTTLAMGFLTALVTKAGEDGYEKTKELTTHIYEAIRQRFAHEQDSGRASQALQVFVDGDVDYSSVVEKKLITLLQADPAFAHELAALVQSGPRQTLTLAEEAQASRIRMSNALSSGQQDIHLGTRSRAEGIDLSIGEQKPASE